MSEVVRLTSPLPPSLPGKPGPADAPDQLEDCDHLALEAMQDNLRFWVRNIDALGQHMEAIDGDPARAKEFARTSAQLIIARDKAQVIAVQLVPYQAPRVSPIEHVPPRRALGEVPELPNDPVEAERIYREFIRGVA